MKKIVIAAACLCLFGAGIFAYTTTLNNKEYASTSVEKSTYPTSDQIYGTHETSASYAMDLDYLGIYEMATNVSIVTVKSINDTFYDEESGTIYTNYTVNNKQNIKGNAPKTFNINIDGGYISMQEYVDSLKPEQVKKMGLDTLTTDELNQYVVEVGETVVDDLKAGDQILVLYNEGADGSYVALAGGYSVYYLENNKYTNAITKEVAKY